MPSQKTRRPSSGRYNAAARHEAYLPATGLGVPPNRIRTAIAAVTDPLDAGANILTRVNTDSSVLEHERARGRISEAAYQVGMIAKAVFERAGRPRSSSWMVDSGVRVDAYTARELAIIHGIDGAERITAMVRNIGREIGHRDARLLQRILGDELTYAEVATLEGKTGERGIRYIARRFRDALEDLAEVRAAKGRRG